jgi:hypothetical protein
VNQKLKIHQLDVRSTFLTCPLDDEVTLLPPQGYDCPPGTVFQLKKAIYGLKQASLVWYKRLAAFLKSIGFKPTISDPCVFVRAEGIPTWLYCHVNDLVIISSDPTVFKAKMESEFDIKYLGEAKFLLGMSIDCTPQGLHIHQTQYVNQKLAEFGLHNSPPASCPLNPRIHLKASTSQEASEFNLTGVNYRALIGSLNYLSVLTRPDILYAVSVLSQHLQRPGIQHLQAAQQVFWYLSGTKHIGLFLKSSDSLNIKANVNSDWGNCPDTRSSVSGYAILASQNVISWKSSRQPTISLSSTEAKYKALSNLSRELVWVSSLINKAIPNHHPSAIPVGINNQGDIDLARSETSQNGFRTKHMDIRLHFVRELIATNQITLSYIRTNENYANFLTKPTRRTTIQKSIAAIGVASPSASSLATRSNPGCEDTTPEAKRLKRQSLKTGDDAKQRKPTCSILPDGDVETNPLLPVTSKQFPKPA